MKDDSRKAVNRATDIACAETGYTSAFHPPVAISNGIGCLDLLRVMICTSIKQYMQNICGTIIAHFLRFVKCFLKFNFREIEKYGK